LVARGLQNAELDARLAGQQFELLLGRQVCHRRFVYSSSLQELADAVVRVLRLIATTCEQVRCAYTTNITATTPQEAT
jgi:hypothetical protein